MYMYIDLDFQNIQDDSNPGPSYLVHVYIAMVLAPFKCLDHTCV